MSGHLMTFLDKQLLHNLEVCLWSLSCWKTKDSLTKCKLDGMACCYKMLGKPCWLGVLSNTVTSFSKAIMSFSLYLTYYFLL